MSRSLDRRHFLARCANCLPLFLVGSSGVSLATSALGQPSGISSIPGAIGGVQSHREEPSAFVFSRFKFLTQTRVNDEWDVLPDGDENFLRYLGQATNVKLTSRSWQDRVVMVDDFEKMYTLPFLFMTSEGEFRFNQTERSALAEFFRRGGFLYADDCVTQPNGDFFYRSFIREIAHVLPGASMQPVPTDHEIYHCFYDFNDHSPFVQGTRNPDMGLFYEDRMVVFLTSGDIHCGWWGVVFQEKQEICFKMGVNIVVYALTH